MSVIAPDFKLSGFIKSLLDNIFWILLLFVLIGLPAVFMILIVIEMPIINGELLTPFLALSYLVNPTRTLPVIQAFMSTDIFRVMAFPGFGFSFTLTEPDFGIFCNACLIILQLSIISSHGIFDLA